MGAVDDIVARLRFAFQRDKERGGALLAKGATAPTYPDSGYDLLQAYGYDALADHLRLEHDLLSRFVDYEEMDDYPEISCLAGDAQVFTLERGWCRIDSLVGTQFHVLSYDPNLRSLVPAVVKGAARTGKAGHTKPMVRVSLDDGATITCTSDHLFLTKEGAWVQAGLLTRGARLMPGAVRMRSLNAEASSRCYWQVHQPHANSEIRTLGGKRWTWVHRLVAEKFLGARSGDIVHHCDHDSLNNAPSNLSLETAATHALEHIACLDNSRFFPEWTAERRLQMSLRMKDNACSKGTRRSAAHRAAIGAAARGLKTAEHRRKIGESQPNRIDLAQERIESALLSAGTIAEAARSLGVSWSWLKRRAEALDLHAEASNHRVLRVEFLDERPDVYDIEVPGYRNFVCNGVVVHNSAIDIYADDSSQPDTQIKRTVWVTSPDKALQNHLDDWLHKRLRMDEEIWDIARSVVKYGNDYEELLINHEGVVGLNYLPPPTVRRIEGPRGELHGFIQDFKGRFGYSPQEFQKILAQRTDAIRSIGSRQIPGARDYKPNNLSALEPWEVVHFRLRGKFRRSVYGYSVLESSRWIWKRLMLMEDAAMIYRLQRAPERFAFYVDVGDLPPAEALAYLNRVRQQHRKKKFVNPSNNKLDLKFEPLSQDDDFYVPVRNGVEGTRIETLGAPAWQHMDDVEYFRGKMLAALKVPKAYLAQEEGASKAVLSSEDVRFARSVLRVQRELRNGLKRMARTHLAAVKVDPNKVDFEMNMTVPSAIFELAQIEVRNARADLASRMREHVSLHWVLENVYGLPEKDIEVIIKERSEDVVREGKAQAEVEKLSAQAQQSVAGSPMEHLLQDPSLKRLRERIQRTPRTHKGGISEQELFHGGNRESEKRATEKLDKLLKNDAHASKRLVEIGALLRDVAHSARKAG